MPLCLLFFLLLSCLARLEGQIQVFSHSLLEQKLPSQEVYAMYQDKAGFIWIGTDRGLASFDGERVEIYTTADGLTSNIIRDFYEDNKGRLWLFSFHGGPCYMEKGEIKQPMQDSAARAKLKEADWASMWVDTAQGDIYFGLDINKGFYPTGMLHNLGIYILNEYSGSLRKLEECQKEYPLSLTLCEQEGNLLYSASFAVVTRRHYEEVEHKLIEELGLTEYFKNTYFYRKFIRRKNGNIVGLSHIGIFEYLGDSLVPRQMLYDQHDLCTDIYEDKAGQVWVATFAGVLCYGNGLENPPTRHLLKNYRITGILEDNEGNYWFSSLSNGVFFLPYTYPEQYLVEEEGNANPVCSMEEFQGDLYIATFNRKIWRWKQGHEHIELLYNLQKENTPQMSSLQRFGQQLLLGQEFSFNGEKILTNADMRVFKSAYIYPDSSQIVLANSSGLLYLDRQLRYIDASHEYGFYYRSEALYCDADSNLWIGTMSGLFQTKLNSREYKPIEDNLAYTKNRITSIVPYKEYILFAAHGPGLLIYHKEKGWQKLGAEQGLISGVINTLYVQGDSAIWLGTDKGLQYIQLEERKQQLQISQSRHIGLHNGLAGRQVFSLKVWRGRLWVGCSKGLTVLPLARWNRSLSSSPVYLRKVESDEKNYPARAEYTFSSTEKDLIFHIGAISFNSQDRLYRYFLEGQDKDLQYSRSSEIKYTNLSPGDYRLRVAMAQSPGTFGDEYVLDFVIYPHITEQFWFRVAFVLFVLLITGLGAYTFGRYRRRQEQLQRELLIAELKLLHSQMNPHFLFNALNSISYFVISKQTDFALSYLQKFSQLIRGILESSRVQRISLSEELDMLRVYLEIESLRMGQGFSYEIESMLKKEEEDYFFIPPMLIQPLVENALVHGLVDKKRLRKLTLCIEQEKPSVLCIKVDDNGIGREAAAQKERKGMPKRQSSIALENSQERLNTLRKIYRKPFKIEIVDKYDERGQASGTRVLLRISHIL